MNLDHGSADTVAALVLGGIDQAPGTYSAATHPAFITGTGSLVVPVADPFVSWIASFTSLTNPADKEKSADPDDDGLSNLLEFAFDGNPDNGGSTGKVRTKLDSGHLTLTLPVRDGATFNGSGPLVSLAVDGLVYRIDASADLSGFAIGVEETAALTTGLPDLTSGWAYRTFRIVAPVNTAPKGFLRAAATEAP